MKIGHDFLGKCVAISSRNCLKVSTRTKTWKFPDDFARILPPMGIQFVMEWRELPWLRDIEISLSGEVRRVLKRRPMPKGGTRVYADQPFAGSWDGVRYTISSDGKT